MVVSTVMEYEYEKKGANLFDKYFPCAPFTFAFVDLMITQTIQILQDVVCAIKSVEGIYDSMGERNQRHGRDPLKCPGMISLSSQLGCSPFHFIELDWVCFAISHPHANSTTVLYTLVLQTTTV